MSSINLLSEDQSTCLRIAHESILYGLEYNKPLPVTVSDFSASLQQTLCCFVTLHKHGQLRGCIGALEAYQPLIKDISDHAFAAAFQDPRFPAVDKSELDQLVIEISVLGKPESVQFDNEQDLLNKIRAGIDGLILEHGYNRGTFLPAVWEQLPDKQDFLNHLKMKAGLSKDWWQDDVVIQRYETFQFE